MKNKHVKTHLRSQTKYSFDYKQEKPNPGLRVKQRKERPKPRSFREIIHELALMEEARTDCKHDLTTRIQMSIKAKVVAVLEKRFYRETENYGFSSDGWGECREK